MLEADMAEMFHHDAAPQQVATGHRLLLVISWLWVGVPLAWGVLETLGKSLALFR
jgi:hypothetical protein